MVHKVGSMRMIRRLTLGPRKMKIGNGTRPTVATGKTTAVVARTNMLLSVMLVMAAVITPLAAHAALSGGSGGAFTNRTSQSFTANSITSQYHIFASGIDTGKPIGLMLHFHGDGAADYTDYDKDTTLDADGTRDGQTVTGLVKVAHDYNMILVSVKSPATGSYCSSGSPCWWDDGNPNSAYVASLMQSIYSQYNIDTSRVWFVGYSGGAQLITQYLVLQHSDLFEGGGAVIFAGGGSPVGESADPTPDVTNANSVSAAVKANFRMFWFTGTNDHDDGDGYDSRTDANEGSAWYTANGFSQVGSDFTHNITHDQVENGTTPQGGGWYGLITRQQLALAYPATPADTTAPTVSLTSPTSGVTVDASVNLAATASDDTAVTKVEFYSGTTLLNTDTSSPYSYTWDTSGVANGTYNLTAKAYDAADNVGTSTAVSVTVQHAVTPPADTTAPTVSLTSPTNGATVDASVDLAATASDDTAVTRVEFYNGTDLVHADTTSPYSYTWDTSGVTNGTYSLTAKAYDAAGNVGTSTAVSVTVQHAVTPPSTKTTTLAIAGTAGAAQTPDAVGKAVLSVTNTSCGDIASGGSLVPTGVVAPAENVTIVGGIEFTLNCSAAGGTTRLEVVLGAHYDDVTKLRVYKTNTAHELIDVTNKVSFENRTVGSTQVTVLAYDLVDGADFDEDGVANSVINDPIYVGVLAAATTTATDSSTSGTTATTTAATLAKTGSNAVLLGVLGAALMLTGAGTGVWVYRRQRS